MRPFWLIIIRDGISWRESNACEWHYFLATPRALNRIWRHYILVTLAIVVILSSIVVAFVDEFVVFFKYIFSITGMLLLLPLLLASLFIEIYDEWGSWILLSFQNGVHHMVDGVLRFIPFQFGAMFIVYVLYLLLVTAVPFIIFQCVFKSRMKRTPSPFVHYIAMVLWCFSALMLVVMIHSTPS